MSSDLMETFNEPVKYFNKFQIANWAQLNLLLHEDIKMKRIDDLTPNSYRGKAAVRVKMIKLSLYRTHALIAR